MRTHALSALIVASTAGLALAQGTVTFKVKSEGVSKELGYYAPQRVELSKDKPEEVKKVPEGLSAPMYGKLPIEGRDGKAFYLVIDEPEGKPAALFIDTNANGDLTDDPKAEWTGKESKAEGEGEKAYTQYSGGGWISVADDYRLHLNMYRFDKADPKRAQLADKLLFYRDYATTGEVKLGDKSYKAMLVDDRAGGDFTAKGTKLVIDVDGDGKWDRIEAYDAGKPFNIGGTTYELADVSKNGLTFAVRKSDKTVAEVKADDKPAAAIEVGKNAIAFDATVMSGKKVKFPDDYKGKVVMLDFWATWCPPCMGEMPNVAAAYDKYHERGFEILGVSLDRPNAEKKIKAAEADKGMKWAQVYDGGHWEARVAKLYDIHSIPAAFLVDGDTGKVIATGRSMRGENLAKTIEKALAEKGKS